MLGRSADLILFTPVGERVILLGSKFFDASDGVHAFINLHESCIDQHCHFTTTEAAIVHFSYLVLLVVRIATQLLEHSDPNLLQ